LKIACQTPTKISTFDVILFDECSMSDLHLFKDILYYLVNPTRILLAGDTEQLPPVKASSPFVTLKQKTKELKWPHIHLEESHRVGEDCKLITDNLKCILQRKTLKFTTDINSSVWSHIDSNNTTIIISILKELMTANNWNNLDVAQNVMFISYFHEDCNKINKEIRSFLFPEAKEYQFVKHERVIFTNTFRTTECEVYNNLTCAILKIEKANFEGKKYDFDKIMKEKNSNITWTEVDEQDDVYWKFRITCDDNLIYLKDLPHGFMHSGYCFTTYAAEGLEMPVVIIYYTQIERYKTIKLPNNTSYTASSRAKKRVIVTGNTSDFMKNIFEAQTPFYSFLQSMRNYD
jgi:exodeoxyribonuclease V alpha subunit